MEAHFALTFGAILGVARERVADGAKLRADLVIATGFECDFNECAVVALFECAVVEAREFALRIDERAVFAVHEMVLESSFALEFAFDERAVAASDEPFAR